MWFRGQWFEGSFKGQRGVCQPDEGREWVLVGEEIEETKRCWREKLLEGERPVAEINSLSSLVCLLQPASEWKETSKVH